VITVVDRGFSSAHNLAHLRRAGGHHIAGIRVEQLSVKVRVNPQANQHAAHLCTFTGSVADLGTG
jgi:hypothetical protein